MSKLRDRLLAGNEALRAEYEKTAPKRELALALRALRKSVNLTQQELAKRSGLTQSHISKMEAPDGPMPTDESKVKYAKACGADVLIGFPQAGTRRSRLGDNGEFACAVI